jgi:hypothetical protein
MRLTLKAINDELHRLGHNVLLAKGDGYFYFWSGEAADWLDRTVVAPTLNSLTLKQWLDEFRRLKELNRQIMQAGKSRPAARRRSRGGPGRPT